MIYIWTVLGVVSAIFLLTVVIGAPYVPTRHKDLEKAFSELYQIGPNDVLVDIGSGDGVVCRVAARHGAKAIGYEINPFLVFLARWLSRKLPRIRYRLVNFWRTDLPSDTTIVYIFGESRDIRRMAAYVETQATKLGRPLLFMSYGFDLKDRQPLRKTGAHFLYEIAP